MNDKTPQIEGKNHGLLRLLLTEPEFRVIFNAVNSVLQLAGLGACYVGVKYFLISYFDDKYGETVQFLAPALLYCLVGVGLFIASIGLFKARRYFLREATEHVRQGKLLQEAQMAATQLSEEDFENFDRVKRIRDTKDEEDFQRNLTACITVVSFSAEDIRLFKRIDWKLQPGLNVLLGRNGYGKSLILRALAGVLQKDEAATDSLFAKPPSGSDPRIDIVVRRDGEQSNIRRTIVRFAESLGKVPLLAIPDSRFFDRSQEFVPPEDINASDLRRNGAYHFLGQKPYSSVVKGLFYEICLDFWEHNRDFERPTFQFLQECVRRLTNYDFRFHSIERLGRTGFEIRVITDGNNEPLRIQNASQGTLSVLAMFGLIRSYLRAVAPKSEDAVIQRGSGIVFIDEADAHLHPTWQQKVPTLLKDLFPNVQFVLSAHSPLFVAGCWNGEVAVVRRAGEAGAGIKGSSPQGDQSMEKPSETPTAKSGGFSVVPIARDFVGATAEEIYGQIFDIEELDDTYLANATKATLRTERGRRINEIIEHGKRRELPPKEKAEADALLEENRRIRRAMDVNRQRHEESNWELKVDELESDNLKLRAELARLLAKEGQPRP